jgi:hypothetical protein
MWSGCDAAKRGNAAAMLHESLMPQIVSGGWMAQGFDGPAAKALWM